MKLSAERAYALTNFICEDKERAKELLSIDPAIAAQQINEYGHDYTADEIRDYGKAIRPYLRGHASVDVFEDAIGGAILNFSDLENNVLDIISLIVKIEWV